MSMWEALCYGAASASDEVSIAIVATIATVLVLWEFLRLWRSRRHTSTQS